MSRRALLSKPHWNGFLHLPDFGSLPMAALTATDAFFTFVADRGLADPQARDIALWVAAAPSADRNGLLDDLATAMRICIPDFVARVDEARILHLPPAILPSQPRQPPRREAVSASAWDPLAPPSHKPPRARSVSVEPGHLPEEWQDALRRMALGMPGNDVVVSRSILKRMREKLCQCAWSADERGLPPALTMRVIDLYQEDLMKRGESGPNGLRWATIRASMEELYRFARYTGADPMVREHLATRFALLSTRERRQKALKFFNLALTGNTTVSVLDRADKFLAQSTLPECPKERHRLRNAACILGLYPIAPLRPASASLKFGVTLLRSDGAWVIDTSIQKTHARNPERFVMRLRPRYGLFIDAVLLGDQDPLHLPYLRETVIAAERPLFVHPDGRTVAATYVPRIYKKLTGKSFGTTRTMLHTDLASDLGAAGRDMAMAACHQTSVRVAAKYQAEAVAIAAFSRRQAAASARREKHDKE